MAERNTKFLSFNSHFSAKVAAEKMLTNFPDVGRTYQTCGELWDMPDSRFSLGVLILILEELRKQTANPRMHDHHIFMKEYYPRYLPLAKRIDKQVARIIKLVEPYKFRYMPKGMKYDKPDVISANPRRYLSGTITFLHYIYAMRDQAHALESVKTIDDLKYIEGIGRGIMKSIRKLHES